VKHALRQRWASRSAQERRVIVVVAFVIAVVLYLWLLQATTQARRRLLPAVAELRAQAMRQDTQADEIARLRALPPPPASSADRRQLVQRQVDASGLRHSLVSVDLVDARHVKLVFGSVAFADWLAWADAMQSRRLRFAAVRIEAQAVPGQVSVSATLERPGR
jgi:type II secretory pathway component PulM